MQKFHFVLVKSEKNHYFCDNFTNEKLYKLMTAPIFTTILLIPLTLLILSGCGDNLIAGYNTATKEEREQFNMKRLRMVIGGILFLTIIAFWIPVLIGNQKFIIPMTIALIPICFIGIILANTWAKKK